MKNPEVTGNNADAEEKSLQEMAKDFRKNLVEGAPDRAKAVYKDVREFQRSFEKRLLATKDQGEPMSQKEYERWEDIIGDQLKVAAKEGENGNFGMVEAAECAQYMVTSTDDSELYKTVEAQAGNFYYERMEDLKKAIEAVGGEEAEKDLKYMGDFYPAVVEHLDFKYMSPADVKDYGYDMYESKRTRVHNDVIRHLNGLNALARKYQVRPLTVRDFWTSDLCSKNNQTPAIAKVMRYDRDIVEEYYEIAFSSEVRRRKFKQDRETRWGF